MRCLTKIKEINRRDRIRNTAVVKELNISSIGKPIAERQLGYFHRKTNDTSIAKEAFLEKNSIIITKKMKRTTQISN